MLLEAGRINVFETKATSFLFGVSQFDLKSQNLLKDFLESSFSIFIEIIYEKNNLKFFHISGASFLKLLNVIKPILFQYCKLKSILNNSRFL